MPLARALVAVAAAALLAPTLPAQNLINDPTGLASPAVVIDFSDVTPGAPIAADRYVGSGLTFNHALVSGGFFTGRGTAAGSCNAEPCPTPLELIFTQAVNGAALRYATNPATSVFTAFLHGVQVRQFSVATSADAGAGFFGFDGSVTLDLLRIDIDGSNDAAAIDDIQIGALAVAVTTTPEPATLALLATGLIGAFGLARRRARR